MAGPGGAAEVAVDGLRALGFGECGGGGGAGVAAVGFGPDLIVDGGRWGGVALAEVGEEEPCENCKEDGSGGCADSDADFGAGGEVGRGCGCWKGSWADELSLDGGDEFEAGESPSELDVD